MSAKFSSLIIHNIPTIDNTDNSLQEADEEVIKANHYHFPFEIVLKSRDKHECRKSVFYSSCGFIPKKF